MDIHSPVVVHTKQQYVSDISLVLPEATVRNVGEGGLEFQELTFFLSGPNFSNLTNPSIKEKMV